MKAVKNISRIVAVLLAAAAVVLFFFSFATVTLESGSVIHITGSELAFGGSRSVDGVTMSNSISSYFFLLFILSAITLLLSALSFKFKKTAVAAIVVGLIEGILSLVMYLSLPARYVDTQGITNISGVSYDLFFLLTVIAFFVLALVWAAYILVKDYLKVAAGKGKEKTIPRKVVRWIKDYVSEIKKIVWPGKSKVFRNVIVVLVMCALVGLFVWLVDLGMISLLELIMKSQ